MYAAPIGMVNACDPVRAYDEAINFMSGHQQSYGLEAAAVFAACVAEAFRPAVTVDEIVDTALSFAKDGTYDAIAAACEIARAHAVSSWDYQEVVDELHAAMLPFSPMGDDVSHSPEKAGRATAAYQPSRLMSIEELPLALAFMVLADGDFVKAIEDSVNSGRDTDSIGIMAGAILGAMAGEEVVDTATLEHLNTTNKLDLFTSADAFASTASGIMRSDMLREEERHLKLRNLIGETDTGSKGAKT
jgi:ADP-ribosylglycohydrolase